MSYSHSRQLRRQDAPAFDPKMYYTLNNLVLRGYTLSAGVTGGGADALINVTTDALTSSENWQLFYQSGKYFIRNYDYGAKWQLGLTDGDKSNPRMYPRSGSTAQQWTLKQVTGGWEIGNEMVGTGSRLGMPLGWSVPAMRTETDGAVWNITSNPSAVKTTPLEGEIISPVAGFISANPSPTPTPSSASPSATTTDPSLTGLPTISGIRSASASASASPSPTSASSPSSQSSSSISSGAIAGIAIGAVALLGVAIFALWFFLFRKKRAATKDAPCEVHGEPMVTEKYAYHAELPSPPAELMTKENETIHNRAELGPFESSGENQPLRGDR